MNEDYRPVGQIVWDDPITENDIRVAFWGGMLAGVFTGIAFSALFVFIVWSI